MLQCSWCLEPSNFRWVELQIDALCDSDYIYCQEVLEEASHRLPIKLEATYREILVKLNQYPSTSKEFIFGTLSLLLCAEKTLKTDELLAAITNSAQ